MPYRLDSTNVELKGYIENSYESQYWKFLKWKVDFCFLLAAKRGGGTSKDLKINIG